MSFPKLPDGPDGPGSAAVRALGGESWQTRRSANFVAKTKDDGFSRVEKKQSGGSIYLHVKVLRTDIPPTGYQNSVARSYVFRFNENLGSRKCVYVGASTRSYSASYAWSLPVVIRPSINNSYLGRTVYTRCTMTVNDIDTAATDVAPALEKLLVAGEKAVGFTSRGRDSVYTTTGSFGVIEIDGAPPNQNWTSKLTSRTQGWSGQQKTVTRVLFGLRRPTAENPAACAYERKYEAITTPPGGGTLPPTHLEYGYELGITEFGFSGGASSGLPESNAYPMDYTAVLGDEDPGWVWTKSGEVGTNAWAEGKTLKAQWRPHTSGLPPSQYERVSASGHAASTDNRGALVNTYYIPYRTTKYAVSEFYGSDILMTRKHISSYAGPYPNIAARPVDRFGQGDWGWPYNQPLVAALSGPIHTGTHKAITFGPLVRQLKCWVADYAEPGNIRQTKEIDVGAIPELAADADAMHVLNLYARSGGPSSTNYMEEAGSTTGVLGRSTAEGGGAGTTRVERSVVFEFVFSHGMKS